MLDYLDQLKNIIFNLHQCQAQHLRSVEITEPEGIHPVWVGTVEEFRLIGHPTAKTCFAWEHTCGNNEEELRYVAMLGSDTLRTPRDAVRRILALDQARQGGQNSSKGP
ncbi:MAG: hypothetical protein ACREJ2_00390 [Planctomycetota bacterium]